MSVSFQRIAILEPGLVYAKPLGEMSLVAWEEETEKWWRRAKSKGADAVYARLQEGKEEEVEVVKWLAKETEVLAPAWMMEEGEWNVHLRSGEGEFLKKKEGGRLMGQSCHGLAAAKAAEKEGADYIFLSPIYPTRTHPEAAPLGLKVLREICSSISIPIFALGGVDAEKEAACLDAGAAGIAGIRMFFV